MKDHADSVGEVLFGAEIALYSDSMTLEQVLKHWKNGTFSTDDMFYVFVKEIEKSGRPVAEIFYSVPPEIRDDIKNAAMEWQDDAFFLMSGSGAEKIKPEILTKMRNYFFGR